MRRMFISSLCLAGALLPTVGNLAAADQNMAMFHPIRRVLLISIDGMHALDLANYIKTNPQSTLAQLSNHAFLYTNASTTKPSDSFPGMVGIVAGGTPAVTGIYYDDAWHRKLSEPADTACAKLGARIDLKQGIDVDPAALDTVLDPLKLPRDPAKGCSPVYPHDLLRVNTVFEVIRAAGMHTAYSEKRPSYDILNGLSGKGVVDLYTPEIAYDNTLANIAKTKAFDDLRVTSILNEINGKKHDGSASAPVPAIFGMNFQAINSAKKVAKGFQLVGYWAGGYTDSFSTFGPELLDVIQYTDASIGKMVAALRARNLYDSTAIIITAKHGESALDPTRRTIVLTSAIKAIVDGVQPGLIAQLTQKANALIWLTDQSRTELVAQTLAAHAAEIGAGQILSGESLKLLFPDPLIDPTPPDIIVVTNTGVNFEPTLGSTTLAEHGGLGENDTHVPLMVAISWLPPATVRAPVQVTQIAPTILVLLGLNPYSLKAVQMEGTPILPIPGLTFLGF